jgi:hypothetical protein
VDKQVCPGCGMIGLPDRMRVDLPGTWYGGRYTEGESGKLLIYNERGC